MLFIQIINTNIEINEDICSVKSLFIENQKAYNLAKLISQKEKDNIVIINDFQIQLKKPLIKKMIILHVFLNGKEDLIYEKSTLKK